MKVDVEPGKYIVAVSGGVDSIVLLDVLSKRPELELVVAHFDHGIRKDSHQDIDFVKKLASRKGLEFATDEGRLGPGASEEAARKARYEFLKKVQKKHNADAVITAHHQDDLVETAALNLFRGTGPKGLSSMKSRPGVLRPLLDKPKKDLIKYAKANNLSWRDDPTNLDQKYYRNFIRHSILPKLPSRDKNKLLNIIQDASSRDREIDEITSDLLDTSIDEDSISRLWLASLPHPVVKELLTHWLRKHAISFDRDMIDRLSVRVRTLPKGKRADVSGGWAFVGDDHKIRLQRTV